MPFKKGYTPHNKGKKGYTNSGSFKKGHASSMKGKKHPMALSDEERKKKHREHSSNYRKKHPKKVREYKSKYSKEHRKEINEHQRERRRKNPEKDRTYQKNHRKKYPEKVREYGKKGSRKYFLKYPEKVRERNSEYRVKNREKTREYGREHYKENREIILERTKKDRVENPEKYRKWGRNYRKKHPEKIREWVEKNREVVRATKRKSAKKHPRADTPIMTKYRRSHRVCEWSYCDSTSVQVHHILPQFKYRDYIDGNYHGRIGNNFICYCPFHHFAYHFAYSTNRNDKGHQKFLPLIWLAVEQWASDNKISIEDLEIELAQMYTTKVILA